MRHLESKEARLRWFGPTEEGQWVNQTNVVNYGAKRNTTEKVYECSDKGSTVEDAGIV